MRATSAAIAAKTDIFPRLNTQHTGEKGIAEFHAGTPATTAPREASNIIAPARQHMTCTTYSVCALQIRTRQRDQAFKVRGVVTKEVGALPS